MPPGRALRPNGIVNRNLSESNRNGRRKHGVGSLMPWGGSPLPTTLAGPGRRTGSAWGLPQEPQGRDWRVPLHHGLWHPHPPGVWLLGSILSPCSRCCSQWLSPCSRPTEGVYWSRDGFGGPVQRCGSRCCVPSCAQLLQVRAARMRATEPQFLRAGDKDLLVSRCCRVSSCCRTSSSPSLILGSPWGMGSAQPAPPSFGVPAPVSVPRGQWDRAVGRASFPLPRYLCNQLLAPRRDLGLRLPLWFPGVCQCV